jgi:hypothetical protein
LTSDRKIRASRANARASTGPKTAQGRARAARNALRHGLSLPVYSNPALSEEVVTLACEIAGPAANAEIQELARRVAEAQIDLRRVRNARHQLLSDALADPYYESRADTRAKIGVIKQFLGPRWQTFRCQPSSRSIRPQRRKGRPSSQQFSQKRRNSCWPWIGMNGGRCRDANLPSGPLTKHAGGALVWLREFIIQL